ncbi:MAG TPA: hypothetical protein DEA69_00875 [Microbacterium sp.]|uniref:hypothetical protein n=1 Tax=unclassified Microbacterium TaxID=2609290 RepID=UPI000C39B350|nr:MULTISPECIES: hypothetical protein [unclassified Microbacterium]MBU20708.1 hypothetical protein [Microbacterium sp.]HBS07354.1 hypothetical protein [Microbacterium sp.]HBU41673.1 hypothetical protein [Microbacterium sp.]|tara:strand:- start:1931 stop:2158 length:228 start_codon:yes stop_codon:yes gene_type:complete
MSGPTRRGRGRPKRQYRIRVRGERREHPDYDKLARALLEHAAIEDRARREKKAPLRSGRDDEPAEPAVEPNGGGS